MALFDVDKIEQYLTSHLSGFYDSEITKMIDSGSMYLGAGAVSFQHCGNDDLPREVLQKIQEWLSNNDTEATSFQKMLVKKLKEYGYEHDYPQFYRKADIDRRLFSKMVSEAYVYHPDIKTVFKCIIGFELKLEDAENMLKSASYFFGGSRFNLLIQYCVENGIYDHMTIDEILYSFGEDTLYAAK